MAYNNAYNSGIIKKLKPEIPTTESKIIDKDNNSQLKIKISKAKAVFKSLDFKWNISEEPYSEKDYLSWISPITNAEKLVLIQDIDELSRKSEQDVLEAGYIDENGIFQEEKYLENFMIAKNRLESSLFIKNESKNNSKEPAVPLPLVFPRSKTTSCEMEFRNLKPISNKTEYMAVIWNAVFDKIKNNNLLKPVSIEKRLKYASGRTELDNKGDSSDIIHLKFPNYIEDKLYNCGINKSQNQCYNKDYGKNCQPYSLQTRTDDIEEFICGNLGDKLFDSSHEVNIVNELIEENMEKAWKLHNADVRDLKFVYQNFINSMLGRYSSFISNVAEELADSLTVKLRRNEYIVKSLQYQKCLMLITHNKLKENSVYVSFLLHKDWIESMETPGNVFLKLYVLGDYLVTRFVKFNESKLFNLARCEAIMFNVCCFFQAANKIEYWKNQGVISSPSKTANVAEAMSMIKFCLIILLNDHQETDELITLSRHVMMTGFIEKPLMPNPQKMFNKISRTPDSRLEIWVIKRLILSSQRIVNSRGFRRIAPKSNGDKVTYLNLFNPFNQKKIKDVDYLINLFYCGYLKNKNERPEANGQTTIFKKVLELENLLPNYKYLSRGSISITDQNLSRHMFSNRMLKLVIDESKDYLAKEHSDDWEKKAVEEFLKIVSSTTIVEFANLKSSSGFNKNWYEGEIDDYSKKTILEALYSIVGDKEVFIIDLALKCLAATHGCIHAEIFQKNNHSGIREIFILRIYERVVQFIIETLAKTLCEFFPSEIMTHPDNKFDIPKNHDIKASIIHSESYQTMGASCDAEKWNQNHYVSKFAFMLCRMTMNHKFLHPFIVQALSLWKQKRIMINTDILKRFNSMDFINPTTNCPYTVDMFNAYKGHVKQPWAKKRNLNYIQTESGMMQGILHCTSSLFHTLLQEWLKSHLTKALMLKLKKYYDRDEKVVIDIQQSSDDSSMLISFKAGDENKVKQNLNLSSWAFKFKANTGYLVGIWNSVKSIENCPGLVEFNSEYFFNGEIYRPTLREVISSVLILETDSLFSRQETMSTHLTDIIECGGSYMLATFCQIGQCLQFYRFLGSNFSQLFSIWIRKLKLLPDPGLGFFLMDHPLCAGLLGMRYNVWNAVRRSPELSSAYVALINEYANKYSATGDSVKCLSVDSDTGFLNSGNFAVQRNQSRVNKIFDNLNFPVEWRKMDNIDPRLFYITAKNGAETRLKLLIKLASFDAEKLLSFKNSVIHSLIPGIYSLSEKVFSKLKIKFSGDNVNTDEDDENKCSLMMLLNENLRFVEKRCIMTETMMARIFPLHENFSVISTCLENIQNESRNCEIKADNKMKQLNEIVITEDFREPFAISPLRILKRVWFDRVDERLIHLWNRLFEQLKFEYHWLENNEIGSLEKSPFIDSCEMASFFRKHEVEGRTICLTGCQIDGDDKISRISSSVKNNYSENHSIRTFDSESNAFDTLKHSLLMIANGFATAKTKTSLATKVLQDSNLKLSFGDGTTKKLNQLCIIQSFVRSDGKNKMLKRKHLFSDILKFDLFYFGGFDIVQKYDPILRDFNGVAVWVGIFEKYPVKIFIDRIRYINNITKVVVNSLIDIELILKYLKIWASDFNIRNDDIGNYEFDFSNEEVPVFVIKDFEVNTKTISSASICLSKSGIHCTSFSIPEDICLKIRENSIDLVGKIDVSNSFNKQNIKETKYISESIATISANIPESQEASKSTANCSIKSFKTAKFNHVKVDPNCGFWETDSSSQNSFTIAAHSDRNNNETPRSDENHKKQSSNSKKFLPDRNKQFKEVTVLSYDVERTDAKTDTPFLTDFIYLNSGWNKWILNKEYSLAEVETFLKICVDLKHENVDRKKANEIFKKSFHSSLVKFGLIQPDLNKIQDELDEKIGFKVYDFDASPSPLFDSVKDFDSIENKSSIRTTADLKSFPANFNPASYQSFTKPFKNLASIPRSTNVFDQISKSLLKFKNVNYWNLEEKNSNSISKRENNTFSNANSNYSLNKNEKFLNELLTDIDSDVLPSKILNNFPSLKSVRDIAQEEDISDNPFKLHSKKKRQRKKK